MHYVIDYSAPPALDRFTRVSLIELAEIRDELLASAADGDMPEHAAAALESDVRACEQAMSWPRAYVARDDDGYYFAVDWWEASPGRDGVPGVCRERLSAVERYLDAPLLFSADAIPAWLVLEVVGAWTDGRGGWFGSGPEGEFTLLDCIEMAEASATYYRGGIE